MVLQMCSVSFTQPPRMKRWKADTCGFRRGRRGGRGAVAAQADGIQRSERCALMPPTREHPPLPACCAKAPLQRQSLPGRAARQGSERRPGKGYTTLHYKL